MAALKKSLEGGGTQRKPANGTNGAKKKTNGRRAA